MARQSDSDSLTEFFRAGWRSKAVRGALVTACLASATFIGKAALWAISSPWKVDLAGPAEEIRVTHELAVRTDTKLQNSELAVWEELTRLEAVAYCPKGVDPNVCISKAADGFAFMLKDTNVPKMRTPEQAAEATMAQIRNGSLLR